NGRCPERSHALSSAEGSNGRCPERSRRGGGSLPERFRSECSSRRGYSRRRGSAELGQVIIFNSIGELSSWEVLRKRLEHPFYYLVLERK
ncbi:MAG: hypothetical protein KTR24_07845, partial [Saprospiraceae bacterium]|nr:hypothetical protein [Saprospiraceae bacterium]